MTADETYARELNAWLKTIDFYLDELDISRGMLEDVASKNTGTAIGAAVEHFQNQFVIQKDHLEILAHDINAQQGEVIKDVKHDGRLLNIDEVFAEFLLRERMRMQEKFFSELKESFHRFLAKVL